MAEHLQPGENYVQGAVRGLAEELGIVVEPHQLRGPLAPTHRRELHQGDFHDCELVQSFRHALLPFRCGLICFSIPMHLLNSLRTHLCRLNNYCGGISLDDGEVSETKWVALEELAAAVNTHPDEYTQVGQHPGRAPGQSSWRLCQVRLVALQLQWFLDEMVSLDWFRAMDDQQNPERQVGMQHAAQPCQPLAPQQLLGAA